MSLFKFFRAVEHSAVITQFTPAKGEPQKLFYSSTKPTKEIVNSTTKASGIDIPEDYIEVIKETVDRGKRFTGGFKISFTLPEQLVGDGFVFEKLSNKIITTTVKRFTNKDHRYINRIIENIE
jgi:hypothetical protein